MAAAGKREEEARGEEADEWAGWHEGRAGSGRIWTRSERGAIAYVWERRWWRRRSRNPFEKRERRAVFLAGAYELRLGGYQWNSLERFRSAEAARDWALSAAAAVGRWREKGQRP